MRVLTLAETRAGTLRPSTLEAIRAGAEVAASTGGSLTVAIIDADPGSYVDQLSVEGVAEIVLVAAPAGHFDPVAHRQLATAVIEDVDAGLVLAPMSVNSLGLVPGIAAANGWGLATDVTALNAGGELTVVRPEHSGKVEVELGFPDRDRVIVSVREGIFERAEGAGSPSVRELDVPVTTPTIEHLGYETPESDPGIDITGADLLVSVGRGIEDEAELDDFQRLAEAMGGTLAVSRPLVDAGWAPSARQVGQSGKTVSPKIYLAMGISGAVQHLAGIRDAEVVIAINTDPEAPIFRVADYGAVADMFEVADALAAEFED